MNELYNNNKFLVFTLLLIYLIIITVFFEYIFYTFDFAS